MKKVVVIGGGTGISTVLIGLKDYTRPTAIVSMMDSGGNSGLLRHEYGISPPGDIMSCICALSDNPLIKKLAEIRIKDGCLKGYTGRNLFYLLYQCAKSGDEEVFNGLHDMFRVKGRVHPVTPNKEVRLDCMLEDGMVIEGEKNIDIPNHNPELRIDKVWLTPDAFAYVGALEAIERADVISIGPGDLYTSVIPNLLVKGIMEGIRESKAKKVYICNLMTKYGETNNFKVSDHVSEIEKYLGEDVIDYVVCNVKRPADALLKRYEKENRFFVEPDLNGRKYTVLEEILLSGREWDDGGDLIRHDSDRLAKLLMGI